MNRLLQAFCVFALLVLTANRGRAEVSASAWTGSDEYLRSVERRLAGQHRQTAGFVALPAPDALVRVRRGEIIIEKITPSASVSGGLLHHWRATAFVPGAGVEQIERLLADFRSYPRLYGPDVEAATLLGQVANRSAVRLRVRQKHLLTVSLDTTYDVEVSRLDAAHGYSLSRSTRIDELDASGRPLSPQSEHGFLWRQNTYWTYAAQDGGLLLQVESISLSREIPAGLGWAVRPFVESVPRSSLEFTLRRTMQALAR